MSRRNVVCRFFLIDQMALSPGSHQKTKYYNILQPRSGGRRRSQNLKGAEWEQEIGDDDKWAKVTLELQALGIWRFVFEMNRLYSLPSDSPPTQSLPKPPNTTERVDMWLTLMSHSGRDLMRTKSNGKDSGRKEVVQTIPFRRYICSVILGFTRESL